MEFRRNQPVRHPCGECNGKGEYEADIHELTSRGDRSETIIRDCIECNSTGWGPCPYCWDRTCVDEDCGREEREEEAAAGRADHMRDVARDDKAMGFGEDGE